VTTLVISPHLDDAVLSVPGRILDLAAQGERVVVLTVFSEGDEGYAARRAEDRAALASLGAEPLHLGLLDAPYRRGAERSFRGLVLAALGPEDDDAAEVARIVADRAEALAPETILLPLGAGEHIDHRIVHAAEGRMKGPVGFYEDRPYALVRHATLARLVRLGAVVDGVAPRPGIGAAGEYLASARAAPHVRAYLPEAERDACLLPLSKALSSPPPAPRLSLRLERFAFGPSALAAAARAARAYASQLPDLFGGEDIAHALSAGSATYEERIYWRLPAGG
jgi:hypothetical protein